MVFEYADLETVEVALLALEHLRDTARWLEESSDAATVGEEPARMMTEAAGSILDLHDRVEVRLAERFGDEIPEGAGLAARLRRRPTIVSLRGLGAEVEPRDVLEVASAEQEETYRFFLQEATEVEDPWLRELFEELADHAHSVVLLLEGEREALLDAEG